MSVSLDVATFISDNAAGLGLCVLGAFGFWRIRARASASAAAKKILQKAIAAQQTEPLSLHPEIDPSLCVGCGTCSRACPEGEVLKLIDHKMVLVAPTKCVGHGECERACPAGAIRLVFGTKTRGMDIPRITADYETNVAGLYIAGELGGMGLIRNAVKQGHLAASHALKNLASIPSAQYDLVVVGAGPAGLAASLTAIAEKKSYLCIEQGSFGGTVYQFPRQKVVMTHPAQLPLAGTMKFARNKVSKEELLEYWNGVRARTGLQISENVRFETVEKRDGVFHVKTTKGVVTARKVVLAMGVRGSPRKLGLANEGLPKVAYNLIDPEQYQEQHVAVVGGGNAGVEAAQYLARPQYRNKVTLLVRGPTFDRCNDENKDIIMRMASEGLVTILFNASVKEIHEQTLTIQEGSESRSLPNDFLFVFAGAEMPHKFLMSLGIKIDKKFGEALGKAAG